MQKVNDNTFYLIFALAITIDQLSKFVVSKLSWSIFFNDQFAFSLPVPWYAMYFIYAIILLAMSWFVSENWKNFSQLQKFAWSLVYAGGVSNILERIILGHVRDFIYIAGGILNIADFYILFGLVLLLVSTRSKSENNPHSSEKL